VLVSATALASAERAPRSRLHFVHVIEETSDGPFPLGAPRAGVRSALAVVEEAERYVEAHARHAAERLGRDVQGHVLEGSARRAILQLGVDLGADLLVVSTHDQRRLERVVLGSVAEALVRAAPFPVLVAKAAPVELPAGLRAPCEHCLAYQRRARGVELWCPLHAAQHRSARTAAQRDDAG
jgi:nucleotide-binding universal stress UspA family protein